MGIIKTFEEFIKESIWADMEDRGTGDLVKKEDDVNSLDCTDFREYLKTKYEGYCDTDYIGRKDNYIKFYLAVGANLHIRYNDDGKTIKEITVEPFDKDFFSRFEAELKSKNVKHNFSADFDGLDTFEIKDKNGNTSNRTVIEFIDNYFNYVIGEEGEKILLKICDKLRPDYENGEEITLDKILDLAKHELVVSRYSPKTRFFNFVEKNYDDILGIIKNGSGVNESIWSDMQDRGTGDKIKAEDNLENMDIEEFCEYCNNRYLVDPKTMGISISKTSNSYYIGVPGFQKKYFLFFYLRYMNSGKKTIDFVNGILDQIPEVKQKLEDRYDLRRRPGSVDRFPDYQLFPKDGSPVTNALFIDMLDYLDSSEDLDHIPGLKKYFKKK